MNGLTRFKALIPEKVFFEMLSISWTLLISFPRYVLGWKPQLGFAASYESQ